MKKYKLMSINEIHNASLKTLAKIDEICTKLNIRYFAVFGTLIGTIRHKGFIPWDDDLDIGMLRPDYNKFVDYCLKNKHDIEGFSLDNYRTKKNIPFAISRFCNLEYIYRFSGNSNYTISGAFVDIYPFDGMGKKQIDINTWKKDLRKRLLYIRMINYAGLKFSQRKNIYTMLLGFPLAVLSKIITSNRLVKKLESIAQRYSIYESKYIGLTMWDLDGKVLYWDKKLFERLKRLPFEDAFIFVPVGYDEYLKSIYGNYMRLPKMEERKTTHGYKAYKPI